MRRISDDLTNSALINDMKSLKERQDQLAKGVNKVNEWAKSAMTELHKSVKSAVGRCDYVEAELELLKEKGKTTTGGAISLADKMRIADIVYRAYGYEGAVLANQLDLLYWKETGESFLDEKSNMFDDELVTVTQLGEIYKMRPADVNRILEANGYIKRSKSERSKSSYISLTPLGRACGGRMKNAPNKHFNIHWPKAILKNVKLIRI